MGRSGGGGGGHHGGGGGFSHRSGGHYGGGYHHHHHSYGYGGGYYSSNNCNICAIPIFIILVIVMVIIILTSSPTVKVATTMSICEQVIACPSSLGGDDTIDFHTAGSYATAYLMKKRPDILPGSNGSLVTVDPQSVGSDRYIFNSFNLVKGSTIEWDLSASEKFHFYLIKGETQFDKFKDYDTFRYERSDYNYATHGTYTTSDSDEYFSVIDCPYYTSVRTQTYTINHKFYDLSDSIEKSSSSHTFHVPDSYNPGACLVVSMPCEDISHADTDISITYDLDRGTVFWVCLVLAILFGLGMLGAIGLCIFCAIKKKKGTTGTTIQSGTPVASDSTAINPYQQVPATPAPAYPAAYQQPQPPAAYNPNAPLYTTAGGVDPSPAYPTDYGTAPPPTTYAAAY